MTYRALILDMDETLLTSNKQISPLTQQALIDLQNQGVKVILASGRATQAMLQEAKILQLDKFNSYIIAYNGAQIISMANHKIIYQQNLIMDDIQQIVDFARQQQVGIIATYENNIYIENYSHYADAEFTVNNMTVHKIDDVLNVITTTLPKLILFDTTARMIEVYQNAQQLFCERYSITRSNNNYVEFMPKNISKGMTLRHLSQLINIPLEQMIACGDSFNDFDMLKVVGLGVAMGNAVPELKSIADVVTTSNDEDGIVEVIKQYFN